MKIASIRSILLIIAVLYSSLAFSQKRGSRFEKLKAWKFEYITDNTSMNSEEMKVFKTIFDQYENQYHKEIWMNVHKFRKDLMKTLDSISTSNAACFVKDLDTYEKKGMQMKHQRNEKMLDQIRPKVVLNILYQEKRFDKELISRIRKNSTNQKNK